MQSIPYYSNVGFVLRWIYFDTDSERFCWTDAMNDGSEWMIGWSGVQ